MATMIPMTKFRKACDEVSAILKAMAHPQRLLVLGHLLNGEKTVSELVEQCEISQSQMSQFLTRMKYEGLVDSRKEGKFQYYFLADQRLIHLMKSIQAQYCGG